MNFERVRELMQNSIEVARKSVSEEGKITPKAGAILTDDEGNILVDCYRGETGPESHCETGLLEKAKNQGIDVKGKVLFVTLEPCISRGRGKKPCAKRIVEAGISVVYIGTLDPNPVTTGKGELYLRDKKVVVDRYPHDLIMELNQINKDYFQQFEKYFLPNDSLFMTKKIPSIVEEYLGEQGYLIEGKLPNSWDVSFDYLSAYCHTINPDKAERNKVLNEAIGHAYDEKYLTHDYNKDVRGKYKYWQRCFYEILRDLGIHTLQRQRTLVVGIGNGQEGKLLYSEIEDLTIVDIAPESLKKANELLSPKKAYVLNAENLYKISDNSIEAYISLMTYQSTFFDINKALSEAYRVLKSDGVIILSIACGFLKSENVYISGLINPINKSIDRNRPFDIIDRIRKKLIELNYSSVGIRTTPSEIFIYGRKNQKGI